MRSISAFILAISMSGPILHKPFGMEVAICGYNIEMILSFQKIQWKGSFFSTFLLKRFLFFNFAFFVL
jgi:hypothetical protein